MGLVGVLLRGALVSVVAGMAVAADRLEDAGTARPADDPAEHWAFHPVRRPSVPAVQDRAVANSSIDAFVLDRLAEEGLTLSAEADRNTLIRRLSLDLRGFPPSPDELDDYLNDHRPDAYERLVDRMLASPHFGERWGRHWLDLARYADSNGFTIDGPRQIWKYREWVIDAFNRDLPFDRFTVEQLAGDLLSDAGREQLIATGFHRNTLINQEGGTDPEQFRVEAVVDRVSTTGAVWLGLTLGCARCHDHKFDPLTQREFYELFAIFNNCDEPTIQVPSPTQAERLSQLNADIAAAEKPLKEHDKKFMKGYPDWEKRLREQLAVRAVNAGPADGSAGRSPWTPLDADRLATEKGAVLTKQDDRSIYVDFSIPPNDTFTIASASPLKRITSIRLEALTHPSLPKNGPGRAANGNFVLSELELFTGEPELGHHRQVVRSGSRRKSDSSQRVELVRAVADHSQEGYPVADAIDGRAETGWAINVKRGSLNMDREAIFFPAEPVTVKPGGAILVKLHHRHADPNYLLGRFRLSVSGHSAELLAIPESIRKILAVPEKKRTKAQREQLLAAYRETDETRKPLAQKVAGLKKQRAALVKAIPTTMVLRERKQPRKTHVHVRGDFLRKGDPVSGDVPEVLPPLPDDVQNPTRLDFARWLVDPHNPLTGRVTVNRLWQRLFGKGLVETENDFGTQGTPPSHPELLDWLASEFQGARRAGGVSLRVTYNDRVASHPQAHASGSPVRWSLKSLIRAIVTSATYRQSSRMRPELLKRDPDNRLLARQSRIRLEAEIIRDSALAAGGLLTKKIGGPGVHPPQPEGIYALTQVKKPWPEEKGPDRYRRGMYIYFWRSSPYPFLPTFDAPEANTTCTRRVRSNTPLQALTLANDAAFMEIARGLAARVLREGPADTKSRLRYAFRLCLSREPAATELERLQEFFEHNESHFARHPQRAESSQPPARPEDVPPAEAAAWTAVARVLLNLDEFVTRE